MKKIIINSGGQRFEMSIWYLLLVLISFFIFTYLTVHLIDASKKKKRLYTEGICTVVTVIEQGSQGGKSGFYNKIKYNVGDSLVFGDIWSGGRALLRNSKYWATYLPEDPQFIRLLLDKDSRKISVSETLKLPSICNCHNDTTENKKEDYDFIL